MTECPECGSIDVVEDVYSPEEKHDGLGYEWVIIHSYTCEDCGCEWSEILHVTREVEIHKRGNLNNH